MIPNQWYAILESNEIRPGKPVGFTRMGEKMVAWRDSQDKVTVMSDLCPHRGVALSVGKVIGSHIQCPFHGFEFDTSGRCKLIPANGLNNEPPKAFQVKTYPTREMNDFIFIWWGKPQAEYPPLPWFDSVDHTAYAWKTVRDLWDTHYSRAIENQLDAVHLPFVHHNTIGRGNRTLVHGPLTEIKDLPGGNFLLNIWVHNEVDQGQKPRSPKEIPQPSRSPFLQFVFPNIWQNWIAENMRIVLAFAPIDDGHTLMYIRNYQRIMKIPVLLQIFNQLNAWASFIIERQDKGIVETQLPKRSDLKIGEKLIQGDGPIIEYRRLRRKLIERVAVEDS